MIVRSTKSGWRIVFQSQHGLVAGELARQLAVGQQLPMWDETCIAISLHDDHEQAFESGQRRYLTDAGAPMDFALMPMDADKRLEETRQRIEEAIKKHWWIGLLASKHVDFLYNDEDGIDDPMRQFLVDETKRREKVLSQMGATGQDLAISYGWMQWCDRCSLILCGQDAPAMNRLVEVTSQPDGRLSLLRQDRNHVVRIEPWPFVDRRVKVDVETRVISKLSFCDDAELWQTLITCPPSQESIEIEADR